MATDSAISKKIEALTNELSMRLMLTEGGGTEQRDEALEKLSEIKKISAKDLQFLRLGEACAAFCAGEKSQTLDGFENRLKSFVSATQSFLSAPDRTVFPGEKSEQLYCAEETTDSVDPQLLVEFIEKHTSLLEELEGDIMSRNFGGSGEQGSQDDFDRQVKGCIHNIKGDAGSIGLIGIERICHWLEDHFSEKPPHQLSELVLIVKEWVISCMRAFAANACPTESSHSVIGKLSEEFSGKGLPAAATHNSGSPPSDLPPEANLELLAELLGEEKSDAKKEPEEKGTYEIGGEREIFGDFAVEAEEHLGNVEETLLDFSGELGKDAVDTIFRGIHSIKGASSYFKLEEISHTSHITENLLDEVRSGKRIFDRALVDLVLLYVDLQKALLRSAREAMKGDGRITRSPLTAKYCQQFDAYLKGGVAKSEVVGNSAAPLPPSPMQTPSDEGKGGEKLEIKNCIKIETKRLDQLIDSIGEMVIYSSMLIQNCRSLLQDNERLIKITHQVEKFSRDLQGIGMSMRLIPIRGLFQKMSRLVWDVSRRINKDVSFKMSGEDTELDRTIIEKLADPLMHMVRDALDHGIEPVEERVKAGKTKQGQVELSAYHSGGNIQIKIQDDGRGLDPEKLRKKAVEKGVISPDANLSEQEAFQLIFAAGFSTAAQVTDISGRGVGMDVVRRNIESMRGRVHIASQVGKGSTFTIELPLTLAIIEGVEVGVGTEHFLIPTLAVLELIRPTISMITRTFERGETIEIRGKFLPLYRLSTLFGILSNSRDIEGSTVVIVEVDGHVAALLVDEILGTYSTVIKGLGEMFKARQGLAGCAIMPNGDVALILDPRSLLQLARQQYVAPDEFMAPIGLPAPASGAVEASA